MRIAFQSNRDGAYHIYAMDPDGANVKQMSSGENDDRHPAWSPDSKYIAVDSGSTQRREIWLIEVANLRRTQITSLGAIASFPSWSPDGRILSFYVYQAGSMDLWAVRPDGGELDRSLVARRQRGRRGAARGRHEHPGTGPLRAERRRPAAPLRLAADRQFRDLLRDA